MLPLALARDDENASGIGCRIEPGERGPPQETDKKEDCDDEALPNVPPGIGDGYQIGR